MTDFDIPLAHGTWRIERAAEKLVLRDALCFAPCTAAVRGITFWRRRFRRAGW